MDRLSLLSLLLAVSCVAAFTPSFGRCGGSNCFTKRFSPSNNDPATGYECCCGKQDNDNFLYATCNTQQACDNLSDYTCVAPNDAPAVDTSCDGILVESAALGLARSDYQSRCLGNRLRFCGDGNTCFDTLDCTAERHELRQACQPLGGSMECRKMKMNITSFDTHEIFWVEAHTCIPQQCDREVDAVFESSFSMVESIRSYQAEVVGQCELALPDECLHQLELSTAADSEVESARVTYTRCMDKHCNAQLANDVLPLIDGDFECDESLCQDHLDRFLSVAEENDVAVGCYHTQYTVPGVNKNVKLTTHVITEEDCDVTNYYQMLDDGTYQDWTNGAVSLFPCPAPPSTPLPTQPTPVPTSNKESTGLLVALIIVSSLLFLLSALVAYRVLRQPSSGKREGILLNEHAGGRSYESTGTL